MTNCIFYTIFFALFLNLSFGSLRLSQVNRAFLSSYKGMYEACVVTVGEDGKPIYPYFSQPVLRKYVANYLEENISKFVSEYDLSISFYYDERDEICPENGYARRVNVSLKANINYLFSYNKDQNFSIKDKYSV